MTMYLPKVRFRVDWDNDSFLNGGVPSGTPSNLIPNAAYAAGAKAAYVIDNVYYDDSEYKEVDELGFTAFDCDFNTADKLVFGSKAPRVSYPIPVGENPNLINFDDLLPLQDEMYRKDEPSVDYPVWERPLYLFGNNQNLVTFSGITVPTGDYKISLWVRVKKMGGSQNGIVTDWAGTLGTSEGAANAGNRIAYAATVVDLWSDWHRTSVTLHVADRGDGFGVINNITIKADITFVNSVFLFQFGGVMLQEADWQTQNIAGATPSATSNATVTWNSGTSRYEVRSITNVDYGLQFQTNHVINRSAYIGRVSYSVDWVGGFTASSRSFKRRAYRSSGFTDEIAIGDSSILAADPMNVATTSLYFTRADILIQDVIVDGDTAYLQIQALPANTAETHDIYNIVYKYVTFSNTYWDKNQTPEVTTDIILETGNNYNVSMYLNHDGVGSKDVDISVYGVDLVDGSLTLLNSTTVSVNPDRERFQLATGVLADNYGLYVEIIQTDLDATLSLKGAQLTLGANPVAFNVGSYAELDDITAYVKAAQWKSGRNNFDDNMAYEGSLDLTLNNDGQEFSIENVNSPYYGLLRQNIKILFEVQLSNIWYPLWAGWTRFFDVTAGTNSSREVALHAEQGIYRLREGSFSYAPTEDTRMDDVIKAVISSSGWRSAKSPFHTILSFDAILDINTYLQASEDIFSRIDRGKQSLSLVGMDWGRETTPDKALQQVLGAEQAKLWIDRQGGLVLVNRNHLINAEDSFTTDITLDTEVQDASYNFGEGIVNRIQVMYQEKKEVVNAVIWQSKTPIRLLKRNQKNIYGSSTKRFPLHFTFEETRQRTITKLNTRINDFDITVRNIWTGQEITDWRGQVWPSITSDGGNRIELQLRNNFDYPIDVDFTLYGNYLEGGQSQVIVVEDTNAQEYIQAVHEKIVETSVLSDLATAVNLAKWDIARYANPRGEFRVIETYVDSPEILSRLLSWELGTILKISELVTGEVDRFHIIIAEEGSYAAGDTLRVTHRMARGDDNYYNKVGYSTLRKGTLNHAPVIDILEADLFGSDGASVEKVSYLSDGLDNAIKVDTKKYGGCVWFGKSDAHEAFDVRVADTHFANYSVPTNSSTQRLTFIGLARSFFNKWISTTFSTASTLDRAFAWAVSKGANNSPSTWALMPQAAGKVLRFSTTMYDVNVTGSYTNVKFDADSTNNLNSGTVGAISKTVSQLFTVANTGESRNDSKRHVTLDFFVKVPTNTNGIYARVSRLNTGGGSPVGTHNFTDPTMTDLNALKNTTLKANTEYHISLWAGADSGDSVDLEVVILEHDTANEIVVPLTVSAYGKYTDTFTTSATLAEPRCSIFLRLKGVDTPAYITGLAITEEVVASIEEANTRQALAAYSFI